MPSRSHRATTWTTPSRALSWLALALGLGVWSWSCAAAETPPRGTTATTSGAGGQGGEPEIDAGLDDGPIDEDAACVKAVLQAKPIPLDIAILLDRSGSMNEDGKWTGATGAIKAFVNDPASAGIGVGLAMFPFDTDVTTCDYHDYEKLLVPIGELPKNATAIFGAIKATGPGGNTPMYGALKGALLAASAHRDAHPSHKVIVLLSSDGLPGSCAPKQNDIPHVAALAASAYAYGGMETYVIAMSGTDVDGLSQIAAAGGTVAAYDVTSDVTQLSQKMAEIRGSAIACELLLPEPPAGSVLDLQAVNVEYLASGKGDAALVPQAAGPGDCAGAPGWYYDNAAKPSKILLCPASCTTARADPGASIKILLGCTTLVN